MATVVTYNGITMNSVATTHFAQAVQYDASGSDALYWKYTLTFEGIVHAQGVTTTRLPWVGQGLGSGSKFPSVQQAYVNISKALWQPRQTLAVTIGGALILSCGTSGNPDLDNGPKPQRVELSHITANSTLGPTFHVVFEIQCAAAVQPGSTVPPVLDNRWSIHESMDEEFFTTRSISGQIRCSQAQFATDGYRGLVVPALESGFKREHFEYNVHPDSLTIDYVCTDKQVHTAPPWPAVKINVRHSESTADAASFESEIHVALKGAPNSNKLDLFALAMKIIQDRLGKIGTLGKDDGKVPLAFSIVDEIGERNGIEVYFKINHQRDSSSLTVNDGNFLGCPLGALGRPLGDFYPLSQGSPKYNPTVSPVPSVTGYVSQGGQGPRPAPILALALNCFLQVPTDNVHWIGHGNYSVQPAPASPPLPSNSPTPPNPPSTSVTQNPNLDPYALPSLTSSQNSALYTFCTAETTLGLNPLRVQLPIADSPANYKAGADTCVVCTLGLPQGALTFHIECERVGDWPDIPEPVPTWTDPDTKIRGTLLLASLKPMPPTLDALKIKAVYRLSARIVYALNRPPLRGERIPIGVLPFTSFRPTDTALTLSTLYNDPNQQIPGAPTPSPGLNSSNPTGY